jgi:hypothetical protein
VYDLELPHDFIPTPIDGEVAEFQLYPIQTVKELLLQNKFKPEAALVVIDFLVRFGLIDPCTPGFTRMISLLHRSYPFSEPRYDYELQ